MKITAHDIDVAARTAAGEARGESFQGQVAVCYVGITRAQLAEAYFLKHGRPHPECEPSAR